MRRWCEVRMQAPVNCWRCGRSNAQVRFRMTRARRRQTGWWRTVTPRRGRRCALLPATTMQRRVVERLEPGEFFRYLYKAGPHRTSRQPELQRSAAYRRQGQA